MSAFANGEQKERWFAGVGFAKMQNVCIPRPIQIRQLANFASRTDGFGGSYLDIRLPSMQ